MTGAVLCDSTYDGNGYAKLYIDENSSWIVTGNSSLTALYCAGSIKDTDGKTVSIVKAVEYCSEKGIMQGKENSSFAPKDNATRAETAAVLQSFMENN